MAAQPFDNPSTGLRTPQTVLVVNDNRDLTRPIEYNLTEEGYAVHVAHDGQAGWRTLTCNRIWSVSTLRCRRWADGKPASASIKSLRSPYHADRQGE
jgi:DNA-binding NtrC family response regulator